ncbi:MAG: lipopolysaccharide kinase InaA family protein, partial [Planctomycetota bacterium]
RLVYRWRSSKAQRSLDHALHLQRLDLPTPRPLAAVEQRHGAVLLRSFYVCAWCDAAPQLREALKRPDFPLRRTHLYQVGALVARLHGAGVVHRDLSPGNILISRHARGFCYPLLDLNRMRFTPPRDLAAAMANLAGLETRDRAGQLLLLAGYCATAGYQRKRALQLYGAAIARHRVRWRFKNAWRAWRKGFAGRPGPVPGRTRHRPG